MGRAYNIYMQYLQSNRLSLILEYLIQDHPFTYEGTNAMRSFSGSQSVLIGTFLLGLVSGGCGSEKNSELKTGASYRTSCKNQVVNAGCGAKTVYKYYTVTSKGSDHTGYVDGCYFPNTDDARNWVRTQCDQGSAYPWTCSPESTWQQIPLSINNVCEDTDYDDDGIANSKDSCPNQKEIVNGYQDQDGCPDNHDIDGDGIHSNQDSCQTQAETVNGYLDQDGCPDSAAGAVSMLQNRVNGNFEVAGILYNSNNQTTYPTFWLSQNKWNLGQTLRSSHNYKPISSISLFQNFQNNNLEVALVRDAKVETFWNDSNGWHAGEQFGSQVQAVSLIQNTVNGNLEAVTETSSQLITYWHDSNGWHQGASLCSGCKDPSMIQNFRNGNFELVATKNSSGVLTTYYYTSNKWHEGQSLGNGLSQPSLIQNHVNGNLELVARKGNQLVAFWHDGSRWHEGATFASGVTGKPTLIQNKSNGNLEVIVPTGSVWTTYWHDTSGWHQGAKLGN